MEGDGLHIGTELRIQPVDMLAAGDRAHPF
jgi:hypothetical protein